MTNIDDVTGLLASLDAQISAANAAVQACGSMPEGDLTSWQGFYAQWEAEKDKIDSYTQAGWWNLGAKGAELLEVGTFYGELQGFAAQFKAWQPIIAKDCPGYSAPPSPIPPAPPPAPGTIDWNTVIKYGGIGLAAVAVVYVVRSIKEIL